MIAYLAKEAQKRVKMSLSPAPKGDQSRPDLCRTKTNYREQVHQKVTPSELAPLCCSSNCKRTQATVDLKSRFFASLLRVTHALCLSTLLFVVNTNVPQLRPRVDCTLHRTQYTEDTVSLWISFFFSLCPKMGKVKNNREVFVCFCQARFVFLGQLKAPNKRL